MREMKTIFLYLLNWVSQYRNLAVDDIKCVILIVIPLIILFLLSV